MNQIGIRLAVHHHGPVALVLFFKHEDVDERLFISRSTVSISSLIPEHKCSQRHNAD
jgi:hypothetical protein